MKLMLENAKSKLLTKLVEIQTTLQLGNGDEAPNKGVWIVIVIVLGIVMFGVIQTIVTGSLKTGLDNLVQDMFNQIHA